MMARAILLAAAAALATPAHADTLIDNVAGQTIGADGKPSDCTVTASSGHDVLDEATCAKLLRRARFEPASDHTGAKVAGTWNTAVRWDIPD